MKVIAIMDWVVSPLSTITNRIEHLKVYTVKTEHYGYSTFGKRFVFVYEFFEINGFWEKGIFIPLSEIDELENVSHIEKKIIRK